MILHLLRNASTCLDGSVVENVLEGEQESGGKDRLCNLGCNAWKVLALIRCHL